ncbi:MAG: hypothetical protein WCJ97_12550 [Phycisphaerae bacterium]
MARKHYCEEFKRSAFQLVLQQGLSPVAVAQASRGLWMERLV